MRAGAPAEARRRRGDGQQSGLAGATINSSSESLLSNFSGEPQIVEFSTVSQLTPREPASGTALSGPSLFKETTTDSVKGTYVFSLPLPLYCMQGRFFSSSLSSLLSVPVK